MGTLEKSKENTSNIMGNSVPTKKERTPGIRKISIMKEASLRNLVKSRGFMGPGFAD